MNSVIVGSSSMPTSSGEFHGDQDQTSSEVLDSAGGQQTTLQKHFAAVARNFNILDRLFKKQGLRAEVSNGHVGAHADGVFSNLIAKPNRSTRHESPENDKPPPYDEAAADMAPAYYGIDEDGAGLYFDGICIDGLPVGTLMNFFWNMVISICFQFVGFLMTYILHTSHAARQGSRFGLGLTFIEYGYRMIPKDTEGKVGKSNGWDRIKLEDSDLYYELDEHLSSTLTSKDHFVSLQSQSLAEQPNTTPVLAILLIILGIFILTKSVYDYVKVKQMQRKILTESREQLA